jgi:hypothetical protein
MFTDTRNSSSLATSVFETVTWPSSTDELQDLETGK